MKLITPRHSIAAYLTVFGAIALCSILMIRCKRDVSVEQPKVKTEINIPFDLMQLIKKEGKGVQIPINITIPGLLLDGSGNIVQTRQNGLAGRLFSTPQAYCDDPSSAPAIGPHTLNWIQNTQTQCGDFPHTLKANWTVRTPFDLAALNPNNTSQFSKGRIRFKQGSTVVFQNLNIQINTSDIILIGTDPIDPEIKIYTVTYTWSGIDHYYFTAAASNTLECSFFIYTDCTPDTYSITTSYAGSFVFSGVTNLDYPCQRIDLVYISPSTVQNPPPYNSLCGSIAGTDVSTICPPAPDYRINLASQVQVRPASGGTFQDIQTYASGLSDSRTNGLVYYWEVRYLRQFQDYVTGITSGSFPTNFIFRWRNHDSTGNTIPRQACWGAWSAESTSLPFRDF